MSINGYGIFIRQGNCFFVTFSRVFESADGISQIASTSAVWAIVSVARVWAFLILRQPNGFIEKKSVFVGMLEHLIKNT
jgi:hypothetical protein